MDRENKTIDQLTIAKIIAKEMEHISLADVQKIIQREQELTMYAVCKGYKVVKKNYITLYPTQVKTRVLVSPLNGGSYEIPAHTTVNVRVGEGFKAVVAEKDMPSKICRSVAQNAVGNTR